MSNKVGQIRAVIRQLKGSLWYTKITNKVNFLTKLIRLSKDLVENSGTYGGEGREIGAKINPSYRN